MYLCLGNNDIDFCFWIVRTKFMKFKRDQNATEIFWIYIDDCENLWNLTFIIYCHKISLTFKNFANFLFKTVKDWIICWIWLNWQMHFLNFAHFCTCHAKCMKFLANFVIPLNEIRQCSARISHWPSCVKLPRWTRQAAWVRNHKHCLPQKLQ